MKRLLLLAALSVLVGPMRAASPPASVSGTVFAVGIFSSLPLGGSSVHRRLVGDGTFQDLHAWIQVRGLTMVQPLESGTYEYVVDGDIGLLTFRTHGAEPGRLDRTLRLAFSSATGGQVDSDPRSNFVFRPEAKTDNPANIANRSFVAAGNPAITGIVITAPEGRLVLIRAIGAGLAKLGVAGGLPDPFLQLYAGSARREQIVGVSSLPPTGYMGRMENINQLSKSVGAFPLESASGDCAYVTHLPPGAHTIVVGSVSGSHEGTVLLEVYFLP